MASGWYTNGLLKILDGSIDLDTSTIKQMLIADTYTLDPDEDFVDAGGGDLAANEITGVSGYTGGFGGGGRKTATVTMQQNDGSNRVDIAIADTTWTALGAGDDIGGVAFVYETGGNDNASIPLAFLECTSTPTNGGDITMDYIALGSGGNLRIAV